MSSKVLGCFTYIIDQTSQYFRARSWNAKIAEVVASVPENQQRWVYQVLRNEADYLCQDPLTEVQRLWNVKTKRDARRVQNVIFKIVAASLKALIPLNDLVSIQALDDTYGLVYCLKVSQTDDNAVEGRTPLLLSVGSQAVRSFSTKIPLLLPLQAHEFIKFTSLENEIITACGYELAVEVIETILTMINNGASTKLKLELPETPDSIVPVSDLLVTTIHRAMISIAGKTRRHIGNVIIASPSAAGILSSSRHFKEVPDNPDYSSPLELVGTLYPDSYKIPVYRSLLISNVIIGYKNTVNYFDAGFFYSPYLPLQTYGLTISPDTYDPQVTFIGRSQYTFLDDNGNDYYASIDVNALLQSDDVKS